MSALAFGTQVWEFPIQPQSLDIAYTSRISTTQALSAAYVDMFGPGLGTITLSATTGWGVGERKRRPNGAKAARALIEAYQNYLVRAAAESDPMRIPMIFVDTVNTESHQVVPDQSGLRMSQQKGSPLLRQFSLSLTIIRDLSGGAVPDALYLGTINNPLASVSPAAYGSQAEAALATIPALAAPVRRYEVQPGDTLATIAAQYGVSEASIMTANQIRHRDRILPGLVLTIPASE